MSRDALTAEEVAAKVATLHVDMFRKRLNENAFQRWDWLQCRHGKHNGIPVAEVIKEHLNAGRRVKCGWTATSARGFHNYWILVL